GLRSRRHGGLGRAIAASDRRHSNACHPGEKLNSHHRHVCPCIETDGRWARCIQFSSYPGGVMRTPSFPHFETVADVLFGSTFTLSKKISASLAFPTRPGLPCVFAGKSIHSIDQAEGSLSSRFQT